MGVVGRVSVGISRGGRRGKLWCSVRCGGLEMRVKDELEMFKGLVYKVICSPELSRDASDDNWACTVHVVLCMSLDICRCECSLS